jgi:hypothetical protein
MHGAARRGVHADDQASVLHSGRVPVAAERALDARRPNPRRCRNIVAEVQLVHDAAGHPNGVWGASVERSQGGAPTSLQAVKWKTVSVWTFSDVQR